MKITLVIFLWFNINSCIFVSDSRLTHVVMPFHSKQMETVKNNLRSWSLFPPCQSKTQVRFIFFVSGSSNVTLEKELSQIFKSKCFESVRVEFAGLMDKNDKYLQGSRLMFEQMISKKMNYGKKIEPSHVFYMEPDCLPIRSFWLDAIQEQVISSKSPFWMKGSIYYGRGDVINDRFPYSRIHINGNAIYNVADDEFREFYFNYVRPFIVKNYSNKRGAYDTDIFKFLFWKNAFYTARLFYKFQFSDFIQNHWHTEYSLSKVLKHSPNTYLIHGGDVRE